MLKAMGFPGQGTNGKDGGLIMYSKKKSVKYNYEHRITNRQIFKFLASNGLKMASIILVLYAMFMLPGAMIECGLEWYIGIPAICGCFWAASKAWNVSDGI